MTLNTIKHILQYTFFVFVMVYTYDKTWSLWHTGLATLAAFVAMVAANVVWLFVQDALQARKEPNQ